MLSFYNFAYELNELPEKARQFAMLSVQSIRLRNFFQKLLAIAQNSSVAAFFFFPLIQFVGSVKKINIKINPKKFIKFLFHSPIVK